MNHLILQGKAGFPVLVNLDKVITVESSASDVNAPECTLILDGGLQVEVMDSWSSVIHQIQGGWTKRGSLFEK